VDVDSELFQIVFLQPDHVTSNPELQSSCTFAVVKMLFFFVQTFKRFLGEVSRPARIVSSFCSVSTFRFLSGFSYNSDPLVISLLTVLFTCKRLSCKQAPTFSTNFSSILIFEIQLHYKQMLFSNVTKSRHAVTALHD